MELSLDQIHAYLSCPSQYNFKHEHGLKEKETDSILYSKALHKTVSYYYFSLMGGVKPTAKQMKDKWAAMWEEVKPTKMDTGELLLGQKLGTRPQVDKHVVQGFELIHNFHHYNKDRQEIPIAVNHEFRVPIAGVTITGKFELIRETLDNSSPNRFIEIVDFKTGNEVTDPFLLNNDLNLTIMSYAFRNLFQAQEDKLLFNYLKSGNQLHTSRDNKHFDRMKATIEGVAEGIANKRFYPRQTFMCKSCAFKDVCNMARF